MQNSQKNQYKKNQTVILTVLGIRKSKCYVSWVPSKRITRIIRVYIEQLELRLLQL